MGSSSRREALTIVTLCAVLVGGCHTYDRWDVLVIDSDTRQPIPGARAYTPPGEWGATGDDARTDSGGRARLRVVRHVSGGIFAAAPNYLPSLDAQPYDDGPSDGPVTVGLYACPAPLAGLTIPVDFRGVLRVKDGAEPKRVMNSGILLWGDGQVYLRGQREFYTPIQTEGLTTLRAPPLIYEGQPYYTRVYAAQWADGAPLRFENPTASTGWSGENVYGVHDIRDRVPPRPDGVALFHLGGRMDVMTGPEAERLRAVPGGPTHPVEQHQVYFVGTRDQAAAVQAELVAGSTPIEQGQLTSEYNFRALRLALSANAEAGRELSPRFVP